MRRETARRKLRPLAIALVCLGFPIAAGGQQEPGLVSVDSADALRAAAERPPGEPPFDGWDAVSLPFRAVLLPVKVLSVGVQAVLGEAFRPRPASFLIRGLRSARRWGLAYGVGGVGPRSGPGLELRLERYGPLFVESAITTRTSQAHSVGLALGDPVRRVTDVELGDDLRLEPPRDREAGWGLEVAGSFRRFAEPHFWGVGPGSVAADESDYRWDRWEVAAAGSYRSSHLGVRAGVAREENQVAPGLDGDTPNLSRRFDPATLFGADEETRFLRFDLKGMLDLVRWEELQQRGFRAEGGPTVFRGVGGTDEDFVRWDLALSGYLPINRRQQLALHGLGVVHAGATGRGVPFTHLASLGGERGLRGFATDRFRDRHTAALMSEWRYEVWREKHGNVRVEGLLFLDAGAVAPEVEALGEDGLETSWGIGARVLAVDDVVVLGYVGLGGDRTRLQVETSWAY
jgi:hypothetical protein